MRRAFEALGKLSEAVDGLGGEGLRWNDQKATDGMQAYARARSLTYEGHGALERISPFLKLGGAGLGVVSGTFPGGIRGKLGHYSNKTGSVDSGDLEVVNTALLQAPLPEAGSARFLCMRGGRGVAALLKMVGGYRSVEMESELFNRNLMLFVRSTTNEIALRQLFSPRFIVLLSEEVPAGFWFEVADGQLMGATRGTLWDDPEALDALCVATASVATFIREDIADRARLRDATAPPPPPP